VLTREHVSDVRALFVADPFMVRGSGRWHMFVEVLNAATGKGQIGLAMSGDATAWHYEGIVLSEPFHLSYPYVFEWMGEHYMIPETYQANGVRLYRARRFPREWALVATLVEGDSLVDSSVVHVDDHWWMFVQSSPLPNHDTLRLYGAPALTGPWREHPASPIVTSDPTAARPAGRIVMHDGRLVRFAQDCRERYGLAVRAFEVTTLAPDAYGERPVGPDRILAGSGTGWNAGGMHHVDAHFLGPERWLACVDGWIDV
jgi:hypothetical protein